MGQTLIVGCSFVAQLCVDLTRGRTRPSFDTAKFHLSSTGGIGNQGIAARVLHEISHRDYSRVVVVWSGINRIDVPIGYQLHKTFNTRLWPSFSHLGDTVWHHSGGILSNNARSGCPTVIANWFDNQYRSCSSEYLTDLSMTAIASVQCILQNKQIPYQMSWIYDIDKNYAESVDQTDQGLESCLGQIDRNSKTVSLVNWATMSKTQSAYEWARSNLMSFEVDRFHPTGSTMQQWIKESFDIDLTG